MRGCCAHAIILYQNVCFNTARVALHNRLSYQHTNPGWETLSLAVRRNSKPNPVPRSNDENTNGSVTDTKLEEPAPVAHDISDSDTDTQLEEPAPVFHAVDAEVAQIVRLQEKQQNNHMLKNRKVEKLTHRFRGLLIFS